MPVSAKSLAELLAGCARSIPEEQRELYERFYGYGMSIALHYAGHRPEAEEITHDAFVKFFRKLTVRLPEGNAQAYFGKIVVNAAIDHLRKRKSEPMLAEFQRGKSCGVSERNQGVDSLQKEEIYKLLQRLPPSYRLVFNLSVLEEYSHSEIANRLGISEGTSRSQLFKARKLLRKMATTFYQLTPSNKS